MSSSEARRIHIEAWQTSGMSQAAYCREHDLNARTFGNWVRKHRSGDGGIVLTQPQWEWLIAGVDWRRWGLQFRAIKYS